MSDVKEPVPDSFYGVSPESQCAVIDRSEKTPEEISLINIGRLSIKAFNKVPHYLEGTTIIAIQKHCEEFNK